MAFKDDNSYRLLLLGTAGVGKSTFGNFLLRKNEFETFSGMLNSQQQSPSIHEASIQGDHGSNFKLAVIDTLPLEDFLYIEDDGPLRDGLALAGDNVDAIVLILSVRNSLSDYAQKKLANFVEERKIANHLIIVVTHVDEGSENIIGEIRKRLQALLEAIASQGVECTFITVNSTDPNEEYHRLKVTKLIELVREIRGRNGNEPYAYVGASQLPSRQILLMGMSGTGKSSFGNFILKKEVFKTKFGMWADTTEGVIKVCETVNGVKTVVVDTPPLSLSEGGKTNCARILSFYRHDPPCFDAILLTISSKLRFTQESLDIINDALFKRKLHNYVILIITHADELGDTSVQQRELFEEQLKQAGTPMMLKTLVKEVDSRYLMVDSRNHRQDEFYHNEILKELDSLMKRVREMTSKPFKMRPLNFLIIGPTNSEKGTFGNILLDQCDAFNVHMDNTAPQVECAYNYETQRLLSVVDTPPIKDVQSARKNIEKALELINEDPIRGANAIFYVIRTESSFSKEDLECLQNIPRNRRFWKYLIVVVMDSQKPLSGNTPYDQLLHKIEDDRCLLNPRKVAHTELLKSVYAKVENIHKTEKERFSAGHLLVIC